MKSVRCVVSCVITLLACGSLLTVSLQAQKTSANNPSAVQSGKSLIRLKSETGGIVEDISAKYRARYAKWKQEFLATEMGRREWERYAQDPNFVLTITMESAARNGAGTSKYKWDDAGKLIAATITLGNRIDEGFPNPIYYPVMNSLAPRNTAYLVDGDLLAAAKIAHEFGHVKYTLTTDGALYRRQEQLMLAYNKILLSNGHDARDLRLLELKKQMGGTPVEIWEDREYWGEVNAMLFLRDRITKANDRRVLFTRILDTVELFAGNYIQRFDQVAQE